MAWELFEKLENLVLKKNSEAPRYLKNQKWLILEKTAQIGEIENQDLTRFKKKVF